MSHSFPKYNAGTGLSNVGSYQVAGKPFVSGNINMAHTNRVNFPSVTSWIVVSSSGPVFIGFSEFGLSGSSNIGGEQSFRLDTSAGQNLPELKLKCSAIFLSGSGFGTQVVDIMAGLTGIPTERIDFSANISPSGSNWSGSLGVG